MPPNLGSIGDCFDSVYRTGVYVPERPAGEVDDLIAGIDLGTTAATGYNFTEIAVTQHSATTAATGSPEKRTISCANSRRGGTVIGEPSGRWKTESVGMAPMSSAIRSAPV